MKTKTLGFIGGGRITRILLQAFSNENVSFDNIVVYDLNPEPAANLQRLIEHDVYTSDELQAIKASLSALGYIS